ncbi:MAG: hypothetical protein Q7U47_12350 [Paludibacter sp.]|nr:hypothetical protein [Paludibacter sp.]
MKKLFNLFLLMGVFVFAGCEDSVKETVTYNINEPVFMPAAQFRSSVKVSPIAHKIDNYGKICFYNGYLYISESEKGIHIVDNQHPDKPKVIGFIELLGNADLAIRNNMLYADSYIDLVWFDISNPALPVLKGRLENIFTTALPSVDNEFGIDYRLSYENAEKKGVIVGWKKVERTEDVDKFSGWGSGWGQPWWRGGVMLDGNFAASEKGGSTTGINGSMSRFTIYNDNLYSVINNTMNIFSLSGAAPVKAAENIYVGWNVETIFSYKTNMFMGTPTGMIIYSVADPLKPEFQSSIQHVFGCDPVVVEDDIAYVTIHSGNNCGQNSNELIIIDVKDVKKPKQIVSYTMTNPKGLGIDNGILFVCDDGLKIFNAKDPQTIMANKLAHYKGMDGYDVIPFEKVLMMIAADGLYQYMYYDANNISFLSKLEFGK